MLAHYGLDDVPIGIRRPVTNESFFDTYSYELGEYASKIAYHYSGGSVQWGQAEDARDPVELYREILSAADDGSVTIASIGFFENVTHTRPFRPSRSSLASSCLEKRVRRPR